MTTDTNAHQDLQVVIIGSGFSGLCMAIQLKISGIDNFLILEKAAAIGGTWRENTYPGAACDVPSYLYSFSFEPKPDWSRKYPGQAEILDYINHCAEKYALLPHVRFGTSVTQARYDESAERWQVDTDGGQRYSTKVLVSGTGQLNRPFTPAIPGIENFKGEVFHSAAWNHDCDLRAKRVAVIGNGASAIQFVPRIASQVSQLTIFQRSANWIAPRFERKMTAFEHALFKRFPLLAKCYRLLIYLTLELRILTFAKDSVVGALLAKSMRRRINKLFPDAEEAEKLIPDYQPGCKRILISSEYYPALQRDNVAVNNQGIKEVVGDGIITQDDQYIGVDRIIFATGFQSTGFLMPMDIVGLQGQSLQSRWQEGADAYLGMLVSGFPNFFMLYGPNTNLGHNSIVFMIESQVRYIMGCLELLNNNQLPRVDVKASVMESYNAWVQSKIAESVWSTGCTSWYKTESGKVVNNWPGSSYAYRQALGKRDYGVFLGLGS